MYFQYRIIFFPVEVDVQYNADNENMSDPNPHYMQVRLLVHIFSLMHRFWVTLKKMTELG